MGDNRRLDPVGVVSRSHLPYLLDHVWLGACYQFCALDGSDPPDWVRDEGRHDRSGEGEAAGWRDADTVEFGKEQDPCQAEGDKMPISRTILRDVLKSLVI